MFDGDMTIAVEWSHIILLLWLGCTLCAPQGFSSAYKIMIKSAHFSYFLYHLLYTQTPYNMIPCYLVLLCFYRVAIRRGTRHLLPTVYKCEESHVLPYYAWSLTFPGWGIRWLNNVINIEVCTLKHSMFMTMSYYIGSATVSIHPGRRVLAYCEQDYIVLRFPLGIVLLPAILVSSGYRAHIHPVEKEGEGVTMPWPNHGHAIPNPRT